jgi:hypothetical protein
MTSGVGDQLELEGIVPTPEGRAFDPNTAVYAGLGGVLLTAAQFGQLPMTHRRGLDISPFVVHELG